jgi:hypothetical protein
MKTVGPGWHLKAYLAVQTSVQNLRWWQLVVKDTYRSQLPDRFLSFAVDLLLSRPVSDTPEVEPFAVNHCYLVAADVKLPLSQYSCVAWLAHTWALAASVKSQLLPSWTAFSL